MIDTGIFDAFLLELATTETMSRNRESTNTDNKVYVGDLGNNASKGELEDAFSYYGRLRSVWVARNPPGFAFIEFEDPRDAEDAVRGLDGRTVCGRRCRVELSTGRTRSRGYSGPSRRGRPFHPEDRCYECGSRGHYARDCPLYSRGRRRPNVGSLRTGDGLPSASRLTASLRDVLR